LTVSGLHPHASPCDARGDAVVARGDAAGLAGVGDAPAQEVTNATATKTPRLGMMGSYHGDAEPQRDGRERLPSVAALASLMG
jgi:hypothetical protein